MLADQLTKSMVSAIFMRYCTTGYWSTTLKGNAAIRIRRALRRPSTYTEQELELNEFELANGDVGAELQLEEFLAALDLCHW